MAISKKIVEQTIQQTIWVASDGTEFVSYASCRMYENILRKEYMKEKTAALALSRCDGIFPLTCDRYFLDAEDFYWYKVETPEDLDVLQNVFDIVIYDVKEFPEIICINERVDEIDYCLMSSVMEETVDFYKDFGYKVRFEKLNEVDK